MRAPPAFRSAAAMSNLPSAGPAPRLRALLTAAALTLPLAACDANGSSGAITGVWEGTAEFEADTILAAHNARVRAAYEMAFRFELVEDDGLVSGTITAMASGYRVTQEAGQPADTVRFEGGGPMVHQVYGTYLDPVLEVDVPGGPYEADIWTFDVSGGRAEADRFLVSLNAIELPSGSEFDLPIRSDETFAMRRTERGVPEAAAQSGSAAAAGLSLPFFERRHRSEQ